MADETEPKGLFMSLDDLITENRERVPQRGGRGGRSRGGGPANQQNRFDGGAGRRQQFYAQRGRGRGEGQFSERPAPGFVEVQQTCYTCGEPGHIARECPHQGGGGSGPAGGGGGGPVGPCFACGQFGHMQRECPLAGGMPAPQAAMAPMGMGLDMGVGMGMEMGGPIGLQQLRLQQMRLMQQQQELAMLEQQQLAMMQGGGAQRRMAQQMQQGGAGGPVRRRQQLQSQPQLQQGVERVPLPDAYRKDQRCFLDEPTGDVVVRYKQTDIVRVASSGEIVLNTGGWFTPTTLASMNDALNCIGIRVTAPGDIRGGEWSITDGRALTRYYDGVVLPSKGAQHAGRGRTLLQAFQNPNRSAAAAATAASNAAAAKAGIIPSMGYGTPSDGAGRGQGHGAGRSGGVFNRLGGRQQQNGSAVAAQAGFGRMQMDEDEDAGRARRLKAQGRYNPY